MRSQSRWTSSGLVVESAVLSGVRRYESWNLSVLAWIAASSHESVCLIGGGVEPMEVLWLTTRSSIGWRRASV